MSEKTAPSTIADEYTSEVSGSKKWAEFVETVVVDFFSGNKLEKISLEDGNGNKAKLSRTKDEIKLEYSTTKLI